MKQTLTFIIILLFLLSFIGCTSHKEKKLIKEQKQLIEEYIRLSSELECAKERLDEINKADSVIIQKMKSDAL